MSQNYLNYEKSDLRLMRNIILDAATFLIFTGHFDMLELYDNDEADDDEQKPGTDFPYVNQMPLNLLVWVLPSPKERGDVLRYPNKEADEQKRKDQGHSIFGTAHSKLHVCTIEDNTKQPLQNPSEIIDKMVGEKIQINRCTQRDRPNRGRPAGNGDR